MATKYKFVNIDGRRVVVASNVMLESLKFEDEQPAVVAAYQRGRFWQKVRVGTKLTPSSRQAAMVAGSDE